LKPLAAIVTAMPSLRMTVHNQRHDVPVKEIAAAGQVHFDFGGVERVRGVANLAQQITAKRVLFGSHFPLFNVESSVLKMRESNLSAADAQAIQEGNARQLLARK
jgi:predicted TIM-barrel fold metal-dependent hydrolase